MLGLGNILTKGGALLSFPNKYSFNFDGSNDYLDCGNSTGIQFSGSFSVSFWFNTTDATATNEIFVSKANDGDNDGWLIRLNSSRKLEFEIYRGGSILITDSGSASNDGNWHHVVAVHESGVGNKLYKNGSLVASNSTGTDLTEHVPNLHIGNQDYSTPRAINSLIDEVAVWNTALSASDVAKIASKPVDFSKASTYDTDRTSNLKLWLRAGDKVLPEEDASIARSDFYTDFDNTNDYVDCGADVHDFSSGDFTISGWISHDTANSANAGIVGVRDSTNTEVQLYISPADNKVYSWNGSTNVGSTTAIADEVWTHVAMVQSGSNKKFYINGVLDNTASQGHGTARPVTFKIGWTGSGGEYFKGSISNISVYKTELDAQTISQMAKSRFIPVRNSRFSVVDFDGTNDFISLGDLNRSMNVDGNSTTISTWVNLDTNNATYSIFEQGISTSGNTGERILLWHTNGSRFATYANSTGLGTTATVAGVWYHVAMTINSSDSKIRLYVNGVLENTTSYTKYTNDLNVAEIARVPYDGSNELNGQISSLSIYDVAKSDAEIYAIYQQGITYNESSESSLIHYYRMGDDTSKAFPTIADSSSNSNDGTITNGASDDIVQQMVAGYDMGAFESSSEELDGNSVLNGSFEDDGANWTNIGSPTTSEINTDLAYVRTGTKSWKIVADSDDDGIYQTVSQTAGKIYYVEAYVYIVSGAVELFSNGASIATTSTTGSFQKLSGYYSFGSNTTLTVRSYNTGGTFYIDDVSIQEVLQSADLSDTYPAIIDVNEPVVGAELVTSITNSSTNPWETFSGSSGNTVSSAINSGGTSGEMYSPEFGMSAGDIIKVTLTITVNSGAVLLRFSGTDGTHTAGDLNETINSSGTHTFYAIISGSDRDSLWIKATGADNISNITLSGKKVQGNVGTMTNQASADLVYSSVLPDQSFLATGVNSAYNFIDLDGSDQYIDAGALDSALEPPLSISMWVKGNAQHNASLIQDDSIHSGLLYMRVGTEIAFYSASGGEKSYTYTFNNTWANIVMTQASSAKPLIYVNGSLLSNGTQDATPNPSFSNIRIGGDNIEFEGSIGQTAIWNKELSSTEVSAIYNLGRHGNLLDSYSDNLVGYWVMSALDAKSGLSDVGDGTIYDRSGNSNHGIPDNADAGDLKSSPNAEPNGYAKGDTNRSTTTP